jgi:hypothetical protein
MGSEGFDRTHLTYGCLILTIPDGVVLRTIYFVRSEYKAMIAHISIDLT